MDKIHDLIIIGSGPAGLGAAIYAQRAELDTVIIEKNVMSGGQILNTYEVDNYPGFPGINGFDLGQKLREHADKLGAGFVEDEVIRIEAAGDVRAVVCENSVYEAKTIILATGANHRKLAVPGEDKLTGAGVSYCATCDGAFFKNRVTAVIGGGDVALEDAIFLGRMCKKVYLIHRRNEFRGAKSLQNRVFAQENIEVIWDTVVDQINGEDQVSSLSLTNKVSGEQKTLDVDGVFIAVGILPNSQVFKGAVDLDRQGYVIAGEDGITSAAGIFAAGDIRSKQLRQIVTAVADGANCITSVEKYLTEK